MAWFFHLSSTPNMSPFKNPTRHKRVQCPFFQFLIMQVITGEVKSVSWLISQLLVQITVLQCTANYCSVMHCKLLFCNTLQGTVEQIPAVQCNDAQCTSNALPVEVIHWNWDRNQKFEFDQQCSVLTQFQAQTKPLVVIARYATLRLAITTVIIYFLQIYLTNRFIPINLYISGYTQLFTTLVNIATGAGKSKNTARSHLETAAAHSCP